MTDGKMLVRCSGRAETAPDFASITLTVSAFDQSCAEVRDFSVLGGLLRNAATQALADADGPYWRIDYSNPARDEARANAAAYADEL